MDWALRLLEPSSPAWSWVDDEAPWRSVPASALTRNTAVRQRTISIRPASALNCHSWPAASVQASSSRSRGPVQMAPFGTSKSVAAK